MNILISPLNWGLGHATRIVPIISKFNKKTNSITIVADGEAYFFLKKEFPNIKVLKAPKLEIKYAIHGFFMPIKIFLSTYKIIIFYAKNRLWINKYLKKNKVDLIIADNRFGFFSKKIRSIFITHQIKIETPKTLRIFKNIINIINKINIEKFDECWIPDSQHQLSGNLSNSRNLKIPTKEIGILSRFSVNCNSKSTEKYDILVMCSGPEPQKSIFADKALNYLKNTNYKSLILRGKPENNEVTASKNITISSHATSSDICGYIKNSNIIIVRAGYSTIMDLVCLQKTAIIVPTPGQTEQIYLAEYLSKRKLFVAAKQKNINFDKKINELISKKEQFEINIKKILNSL